MYIVEIKSLVEFIKNRCSKRLKLDIQKHSEDFKVSHSDIIKYNDLIISNIERQIIVHDNCYINYGDIYRISAKDDVKIEIAIMLIALKKHNDINSESDYFEVKYKNLFKKEDNFKISTEFIMKIESELDSVIIHLESLQTTTIENITYTIEYSCEHCSYFDKCKDKAISENSIVIIPNISKDEVEALKTSSISTLIEFEKAFISKESLMKLDELVVLQKDRYIKNISVLKDDNNKIEVFDKIYIDYNKYSQSYKYLVTFQGHSNTDIVYGFGLQKMYQKDEKPHYIMLKKCPENEEELLNHYETIICYLYKEIENNLNQGKDSIFYIFAQYEKKNLEKIIKTLLKNREYKNDIISKVLSVSEYLKFENYNIESNNLTAQDHYIESLVEIKNLIERHLAIKSPFKYTLENTLESLCSDVNISKNVINSSFQFSWALKPLLIDKLWEGKEENIEGTLSSRFYYLSKLVQAFENIKEIEYIVPEKINCLPSNCDEVDAIERFAIYETISSIKEYKKQFVDLPLEKQIQAGKIIECEVTNYNYKEENKKYGKNYYKYNFSIRNGTKEELEVENYKFIEEFTDYKTFIKRTYNSKNQADQLTINEDKSIGEAWFMDSELVKFYVAKSYFDNQICEYKNNQKTCNSNINKILQNIQNLKLNKFYKEVLSDCIDNESFYLEYGEPNGLTDSQKMVYKHFYQNKITLLWGPPGTGKTYCIGKILTDIVSKNTKLKVLVTGFTHQSIENCLNKVSKIDQDSNLRIGKVQSIGNKVSERVDLIEADEKFHYKYNTCSYNIIGSTVYQLAKIIADEKFDVIVVDEASQLKVSEFLMILNRVKLNSKILVVGDHKQLSVILKNKYLDYENKETPLAGSIFEYFLKSKNKDKYLVQLTECFRMNKAICEYPSEKIYLKDGMGGLIPQKNNINQLIELKEESLKDDILSYIADPSYPVVLCLIKNKNKDKTSIEEAELAAGLSLFFRNNMKYEDEKKFWVDNLCIISPHHSQINLIKKTLKERFKEKYKSDELFVDTVDKMQGQEADAVIISYGVTDSNFARKEKEFIYSLNRLNVSITRAKKKLIVMLSEELFNIDLKLIDDDNLKDDMDFFRNYRIWFEEKIKKDRGEKGEYEDMIVYRIKL